MDTADAQLLRAAIALLGWRQRDLAQAAGIGQRTVETAMAGRSVHRSSMRAMRDALRGAGIVFLDGELLRGVAQVPRAGAGADDTTLRTPGL